MLYSFVLAFNVTLESSKEDLKFQLLTTVDVCLCIDVVYWKSCASSQWSTATEGFDRRCDGNVITSQSLLFSARRLKF